MAEAEKISQGTSEWFDMVGRILAQAASGANLPRDMNISFVERYSDGHEIGGGLVQGIRLDIVNGEASFRVGVGPAETGDINVLVTAEAARRLNSVTSGDPRYRELQERYRASGEFQASGDLSRLGEWLAEAHDPIVARTK